MPVRIRNFENGIRLCWWVLLAAVIGLIVLIRIRLLAIPLERDEGEYAYAGQLMLQGVPPYKLAYNMKFPGTYATYAVIMSVFGQTTTGIHLGLLVLNAAAIVLIFLLGLRLASSIAGIAAAATYAVLSVSPSVLGLAAHATHFVILPVLGGTLLLQRLPESGGHAFWRLFASGLLFGIGVLMKQPALFFIPFGAIYLLWHDAQRRFGLEKILLRNLIFGIAAIVPFGITCLVLWHTGVFDKFWFWTIQYALQYGSLVPLNEGPRIFARSIEQVIRACWTLWMLAGFGLVAGFWCKRTRASAGILLGLLASSTLALSAGFYFREHYFILIFPAISLLAGLAVANLVRASRLPSSSNRIQDACAALLRIVPLLVFGAALSLPILFAKKFFFEAAPVEVCRMIHGSNPFPESVRVADYLREHSSPDDTIAVLGSEPQIYFYSKRHSATGYVYAYGFMEAHKYARQMQQEMIREIERARPKYLISVGIYTSWLGRPESDRLIFKWANEYTVENYAVVGLVNIATPSRTDYYFEDIPNQCRSRIITF